MKTTTMPDGCSYCGGIHTSMCPRIEEIEYHPNGTIKRIRLHPTSSQAPASVIRTRSPFGSLTLTTPPSTWTVWSTA